MSWNNNGGPWGPSGKSGNNPWTNKGAPGGGGPKGPDGPPPINLDEIFRKWGEMFRQWHTHLGGPPQLMMLALAVVVAIWIFSGFYQVGTDEVGVVMRFGAFNRIDQPGLRYHAPYPFEQVLLPKVTSQNEIQIG